MTPSRMTPCEPVTAPALNVYTTSWLIAPPACRHFTAPLLAPMHSTLPATGQLSFGSAHGDVFGRGLYTSTDIAMAACHAGDKGVICIIRAVVGKAKFVGADTDTADSLQQEGCYSVSSDGGT